MNTNISMIPSNDTNSSITNDRDIQKEISSAISIVLKHVGVSDIYAIPATIGHKRILLGNHEDITSISDNITNLTARKSIIDAVGAILAGFGIASVKLELSQDAISALSAVTPGLETRSPEEANAGEPEPTPPPVRSVPGNVVETNIQIPRSVYPNQV